MNHDQLDRTSGVPFGRRKASGTGNTGILPYASGGEELTAYSVKEKVLEFGVRGVWALLYRPFVCWYRGVEGRDMLRGLFWGD